MAVVDVDSSVITNHAAGTVENSYIHGGRLMYSGAYIEPTDSASDGSVYRMFRLFSSARIVSLRIAHTAIASGTDHDIGFYQTDENGGAVVDKDALCDGLDLSSARTSITEVLNTAVNTTDWGKRIWELQNMGLSADPYRYYDLCITANTAGTVSSEDIFVEAFYLL